MTSNERKILECIRNHGREAHVRAVSDACGLTSDYTRFLCKSLARSGYLKFADANVCRLLKRGRSRFEANPEAEPSARYGAGLTASKPVVVATSADAQASADAKALADRLADKSANATLLTDEQPQTPKESGDEELDKALADLELSSNRSGDDSLSAEKDGKEEQDKPKELSSNKDEDEGNIDSNPPADEGGGKRI